MLACRQGCHNSKEPRHDRRRSNAGVASGQPYHFLRHQPAHGGEPSRRRHEEDRLALAFGADPLGARRPPRLRVRISRLTVNAVRPVERIPLCRSGADPKSRPTWTGGQQRLFDSSGQSPLHRYLSPRFSQGGRGATSLRQSRDAAAFAGLCSALSPFLGDVPDCIFDAADGILNLSFGGLCLAVRNRLLVADGLAYRLFDVADHRLCGTDDTVLVHIGSPNAACSARRRWLTHSRWPKCLGPPPPWCCRRSTERSRRMSREG